MEGTDQATFKYKIGDRPVNSVVSHNDKNDLLSSLKSPFSDRQFSGWVWFSIPCHCKFGRGREKLSSYLFLLNWIYWTNYWYIWKKEK